MITNRKMPLTDLGSRFADLGQVWEAAEPGGVRSPGVADCDLRADSEVDVEVPKSIPKPILFQVLHPQPISDT